jgi:hypothetical protein
MRLADHHTGKRSRQRPYPDAWETLFVAEAGVAATLAGRLSRQVHTARTPSATDTPIGTTTQPPADRSRPSGGIVKPPRI